MQHQSASFKRGRHPCNHRWKQKTERLCLPLVPCTSSYGGQYLRPDTRYGRQSAPSQDPRLLNIIYEWSLLCNNTSKE